MFMNRLRHVDFLDLYASVGHLILAAYVDDSSEVLASLLDRTFQVHSEFHRHSDEVLAITGAWIVSRHGSESTEHSI